MKRDWWAKKYEIKIKLIYAFLHFMSASMSRSNVVEIESKTSN